MVVVSKEGSTIGLVAVERFYKKMVKWDRRFGQIVTTFKEGRITVIVHEDLIRRNTNSKCEKIVSSNKISLRMHFVVLGFNYFLLSAPPFCDCFYIKNYIENIKIIKLC